MPQSRRRQSAKRRSHKGPTTTFGQPTAQRGASNSTKLIAGLMMTALIVAGGAYFLFNGSPGQSNEVRTASGLRYVDLKEGDGPSPQSGQRVTVQYTGTLESGEKFDSSYDHGQPFTFTIGRGQVIKGWDEGVMSMKVGGKRKLIIPAKLGYGPAGSPPKIPGNATLNFDVELLKVE